MAELAPVVIIAGPTASGKSALAIEIAHHFGGEIVNADSMQVYQDLSVLTARPSVDDEQRIPHHLYGVMPASEACSVGKWLDAATAVIADIRDRDNLPVVCGGTGLYLRALTEGIAQIPDVDPAYVEEAEKLLARKGGQAFLQDLAELDPQTANRLQPSDRQRLVRAYSVARATGKSLTRWQQEQSDKPPVEALFRTIYLMPERAALYQKIEQRFDQMVEMGGLDEVQHLASLALSPQLPAMKALGVPDFLRVVSGEIPVEEAIDNAKQTTRNLAKRQMTWFRNQGKPDLVIEAFGNQATEQALAFLEINLKEH